MAQSRGFRNLGANPRSLTWCGNRLKYERVLVSLSRKGLALEPFWSPEVRKVLILQPFFAYRLPPLIAIVFKICSLFLEGSEKQ